jgi:hypothetical protein
MSPPEAGRAYVISGAAGVLIHTLSSPDESRSGYFGSAVSGVPDLDGDGRTDLLVGAKGEHGLFGVRGAGRVHLFSGASGALLRTINSPTPVEDGKFGGAARGLPDLDGDGYGDLFIGAHAEHGLTRAGKAYIFSGATGMLLRVLVSPNPVSYGFFGQDVAGVPDLDGDAVPDLLVGASGEYGYTGRVYVFSGATGALRFAHASPNAQFGNRFGETIAGVRDVDGDGRGDLLVGAPGEDAAAVEDGRVYVFSGADGRLLHTLVSPAAENYGGFGTAVAEADDINGDGVNDLVVGTHEETHAYVFNGALGVPLLRLPAPSGQSGSSFRVAVSRTGDVDGDGSGDLLVGVPWEGAPIGDGRAYVFSGVTLLPLALHAVALNDPVLRGDSLHFAATLYNNSAQPIAPPSTST